MLLTCIDEAVGSCEERGRRVRLVCVERQCNRAVQRDAAARRNGSAVAPPKRRVDQLARLQRRHLRVYVHVLVHASNTPTIHSYLFLSNFYQST